MNRLRKWYEIKNLFQALLMIVVSVVCIWIITSNFPRPIAQTLWDAFLVYIVLLLGIICGFGVAVINDRAKFGYWMWSPYHKSDKDYE